MFGILTIDAFIHGPIETIGQIVVLGGALTAAGALTYFKRWTWLWKEWLTAVDPKRIGVMYLVLSLIMLLRGGVDALMMRGEQATALGGPGYLSPDHFAQIFTAHGVIMIFFVAMTFMFGLINIILPLQIGARDVAYPFLNAMSFWLTTAGALLVNISLVIGEFAATGWLAYPPLSELQYSPGVGVDYYIWALQIAGIGSLIAAINFLVTIIRMRAPGMHMMRLPIFVWTTLGSMMLIVAAFPILTVTLALLALDRTIGAHFFTTDLGGNAMMYVNLIWAWGHPEVYILMLPGFGMISEIVPVFSRKRLFGYTSMVVATMVITVLSFMVWVHHFFTMGAGADVNAFFGIATMAIAIPTGVKVFNWLFTMFRGRIALRVPMLWFYGFLVSFVIGGMSGVLMSVPAADFQLHNSLFLVAHFHNMVIGGVLFSYFAGFSYWFPKITGFKLDEKWGVRAFWCWIVGFTLAFIPLYVLGFMGMTRRLDFVDLASGYHPLLVIAGIGAGIISLGVACQVIMLYVSFRDRKQHIDESGDPWDGRTLEWSVSSPAPSYNFAFVPVVHGRDAFFMQKQSGAIEHPADYQHIEMPSNTSAGFLIGACAFVFGFAIVWHMWWLALTMLVAVFAFIVMRSFDEHIEHIVTAQEIAHIEHKRSLNAHL